MVSSRGVRTGIEDPIDLNNATDLIIILEEYNVQKWKKSYTEEKSIEYEDGASWQLLLQYTDGSVEKHSGSGTDIDQMTLENYDDFTQDLAEAVKERLEKGDS